MELKYPDDEEKKNSVCIPFNVPETVEDYFLAAQSQNIVEDHMRTELGLMWMRSRRCFDIHHLTLTQMLGFLWVARRAQAINKKVDMCVEKIKVQTI